MILTGIKPTGTFHLGNYMSVIKPLEELKNETCFLFIADIHSLTQKQKPNELSNNIKHIYAVLNSFFGESKNIVIYRQSKVKDIFKLYYILNCFCNKGYLNRNHTYKSLVEKNLELNNDSDKAINVGIYTYPTLMAADILMFNPTKVTVGIDQEQHMEITRYIARKINKEYNTEIFTIPESYHQKKLTLPGIDGRKMSKSYNNIIPLFTEPEKLKKIIFKIATNSKNVGEPKYEGESVVTDIFKFLSTKEQYDILLKDMADGIGFGEIKQRTFDLINDITKDKLDLYYNLLDSDFSDKLIENEEYVNKIANDKMKKIEEIIGVL